MYWSIKELKLTFVISLNFTIALFRMFYIRLYFIQYHTSLKVL